MKKIIAAILTGITLLTLSAPVFAQTYKTEAYPATFRDDHGKLAPIGDDHEASGWTNDGGYDGYWQKLWPDSTYYFGFWLGNDGDAEPDDSIITLLTDSKYFNFSYKKEGGGKQILQKVDVTSKVLPNIVDGEEDARCGVLKLATGHDTTDDEFIFRLTGKFKVRENANLAALADVEAFLGAELEPGDVIEVDFGRFVVGNRKKTGTDKDWDAGAYAAVWDPSDADRNTLLYETEAGTLMEIRLKADTSPDLIYLKLNTSWKPLEEAGLIPEQSFPNGDAVVYTFEDSNNLLSATSRGDVYIHNHPDTALGGESMTDLYEDGKLFIYSAVISDDGKLSLMDISDRVSVGVVDGEKVLRLRDRALTNLILSTAPCAVK